MNVPIKVRILKRRTGAGTQFVYPRGHWPHVHYLAFEEPAIGRPDNVYEWALGICEQGQAQALANAYPNDFVLMTADDANTLARSWLPAGERITDAAAVIRVVKKYLAGTALDASDRAVLNPNDPTPGINNRPIFDVNTHLA